MKKILVALILLLAWISPASAQDTNAQKFDLTASNLCDSMELKNMGTGSWTVSAIAGGAILEWEVAIRDEDALYVPIDLTTPAGGSAVNSTVVTGSWVGPVAGYRFMRACIDAGTATVWMGASAVGGGGGLSGSGTSIDLDPTNALLSTIDASLAKIGTAIGVLGTAAPANGFMLGVNSAGTAVGVTGGAEGAYIPVDVRIIDTTTNSPVVYGGDPCITGTKVFLPFQGTADATLITGTASNRTWFCHVHVTVDANTDVAILSGTGTVCATSSGALFGGTTAATGWQFVDSRGIVIGNGSASIGKTDTDGDNSCIDISGSGQFAGEMVYVVAPA